ncbi:MAG: class I SAM-dependent methyltransferase [Burkholderiales bacterium]|nr:class I SAM-dependent methyltransferase [Burkholderiales bacterium]
MSRSASWQRSLALFFAERAAELGKSPTQEDLCYVSGRDPRLWQSDMYQDLIDNILELTASDRHSNVLEVGCAAGFVARGLAPRVGRYTGVDLARAPLSVARRIAPSNCAFRRADGARLPFPDHSFDAAFCYDVFTNFPTFAAGAHIVAEMLRVVRSAGRVLIGSIPDEDCKQAYERRVAEVAKELDSRYGPVRPRPPSTGFRPLSTRLLARVVRSQPEILCFYFRKQDFLALSDSVGARVQLFDVHRLNPYFGYRFNVVYHKKAT